MEKRMVETVWLEEIRLTPFKEDYTEVYFASEVDARIAELKKELLERGGHKQDCPISWKGECYCGWLEMKQSLMESATK